MSLLRKTVQNKIYETLDNSVFTASDFIVKFEKESNANNLFLIRFIHSESFTYKVTQVYTGSEKIFRVTQSPGEITEEENFSYNYFDDTIKRISRWCEEIRNEIKAQSPIYAEVDKLREILEEHLNVNSENEEYTISEINELKAKFSALEKRIDELEQQSYLTTQQSEKIKKGLEQVSNDVDFYPKKTWLRTSINKIARLISDIGKSPEGKQLLADGARKLLNIDQ